MIQLVLGDQPGLHQDVADSFPLFKQNVSLGLGILPGEIGPLAGCIFIV
jgi:hypothetical protein